LPPIVLGRLPKFGSRPKNGLRDVTRFLQFCSNHIFGIDEARQFKSCVLIDTEEY